MTEEYNATGAQGGFTTGTPVAGTLDVQWIHGAPGEPPIQVHHYDEHTVIMRQAKSVHYEAPFQFLLFGSQRALLLDTGATADPQRFPLRETVDRLIGDWLERHPREHYGLVVVHTHGHGDHVAGDPQFADRPDTTIVSRELEAVQQHFGFTDWPGQIVTFDLGERVLEVTGSPGHHRAAITIYDPRTGFMLTGDSVLPGRLYVFDLPQFAGSMDRLVAFAADRPVTHVLGCHIEMTRKPGRDFPIYARYQPDEHALQLTAADLTAVRDAAAAASRRGATRFDDFILYNQPRTRDMLALLGRGLLRKIR